MSVSRNHCRLDIQLYLDIPDSVIAQIEKPGWKRRASDVVQIGMVGAESAEELLKAFEKYAVDIRYKVAGGNVQRARDTHLTGDLKP